MKEYKKVFGLLIAVLFVCSGVGLAVNEVKVTFTYEPSSPIESAHVAGSFNGWSTTATPMTDEDGDGTYKATVELEPGNYGYRYVINGDNWIKPPNADAYGEHGYGDETGIVYVQSGTSSSSIGEKEGAAYRADGEIAVDSLEHDKESINYANPLGEDKIRFKFKTKKNDVKEVILHYDDGQDKSKKMTRYLSSEEFDYYRAIIEVDQSNFGYQFEIRGGGKTIWYAGEGIVNAVGVGVNDLRPINYNLRDKKVFSTPDWVKDAVFYQIFIDRFYNANHENDSEKIEVYRGEDKFHEVVIPDWEEGVPSRSPHVVSNRDEFINHNNKIGENYGYHVFYGGDLQGVEEKIPYLKELGVNAVYFNPLFEAVSNHKYNTSGYKLIEDNFAVKGDHVASERYFRELIKKLHDNGIKVILDIPFNYTGYEHWAFQDVVEKGRDSEYSDWYFINDYPVKKLHKQGPNNPPNYEAWWGFGSYPLLNLKNSEVKDYLFDATRKWMDPNGDGDPSDGVDGWRLDMPKAVEKTNPQFWKDWRTFVKDINPQAYIAGEVWDNGSKYLQGDQFDAVMNYRFRQAVVDFIARGDITAKEFSGRLAKIRAQYPEQSNYVLQNLIGSHDTERFLTAAGGDKDRLKLASFLQMTYIGAPMIYYGDEVGMEGGQDPDNRRTMVWEDRGYTSPDQELKSHYQKLIKLRRQEPALRRGKLEQVPIVDEMVYGFKRIYQGRELLVLLNGGTDEADVSLPVNLSQGRYEDLSSGEKARVENGELKVSLEPLSGRVINLKDQNRGSAKVIVKAEPNTRMVVRGEMNSWGEWPDQGVSSKLKDDIIMDKNSDGTWSVTLEGLTPGKTYAYKYVLEYKNSNTDIESIGPEGGGDFTFTARGSTHTLTTPFTKEELDRERGLFTIEEGTVKAGGKTVDLGEEIEVGVPADITVNNKYHLPKTVRPPLDIGEVNKITVTLNQPTEPIEYTFTFNPAQFGNPKIVEGVWIKGSFDSWKEHKMTKRGSVYQITLDIYPGKYRYLFFDKAHQDDQSAYNYYKDSGSEFVLRLTTEGSYN